MEICDGWNAARGQDPKPPSVGALNREAHSAQLGVSARSVYVFFTRTCLGNKMGHGGFGDSIYLH
jgi:hypothetical protein